jgi:hypothetical protein
VEVIVRKYSNEDMLLMMSKENMEEWKTNVWVELETVRATIEAYGKGLIKLPEMEKSINTSLVLYAADGGQRRPYSLMSLAKFLGWTNKHNSTLRPNKNLYTVSKALELIDNGLLMPSDLHGLSREQLRTLVDGMTSIKDAQERAARELRANANMAQKNFDKTESKKHKKRHAAQVIVFTQQAESHEREAKAAPAQFATEATKMFDKNKSCDDVRKHASAMKPSLSPPKRTINVDGLAKEVAKTLCKLRVNKELSEQINLLKTHRRELTERGTTPLIDELNALSTWAEHLKEEFSSPLVFTTAKGMPNGQPVLEKV